MKNMQLMETIQALEKASEETGRAVWGALAEELDRSKRRRISVNLSRINRHSEEGDLVAVPGKVLAAGSLSKAVKVAAFSFSSGALVKIRAAGGEAMSLTALIEAGVEPSLIRIMK